MSVPDLVDNIGMSDHGATGPDQDSGPKQAITKFYLHLEICYEDNFRDNDVSAGLKQEDFTWKYAYLKNNFKRQRKGMLKFAKN